jgi:ketosteroid isomerase-like protein
VTQSLDDLAAQWEIRGVVERYANAVDRGDAAAAAALFTEAGELELWLDPTRDEPTATRCGREEISAAIEGLRAFHSTQHVIASSVIEIDGDAASGETRCTAHHVRTGDGKPHDEVLYITYVERLVHLDGRWRLARRELRVQWTSTQTVERI